MAFLARCPTCLRKHRFDNDDRSPDAAGWHECANLDCMTVFDIFERPWIVHCPPGWLMSSSAEEWRRSYVSVPEIRFDWSKLWSQSDPVSSSL